MTAEDEKWDLYERSLDLIGKGKVFEAEPLLERLVELAPDSWVNWMMLGRCQLALQKLDPAEASARKALELSRKGDTWNLLGCVLKSKSVFSEAESCFRNALAHNQKDATSWSGLGVVLFAQGKNEESEEAAIKSLELNAKFFEGWLTIGMLRLRQGRADEAEGSFRELIKVAPAMPEAFEFLAVSLNAQGRHDEATEARSQAAEIRSRRGF
jgi:tetratricopeptide (TPR) repeat protein